jgi:Fe-S oxidoreductase
MDGDRVRHWESLCVEEQPPACAAACPMHLDARTMLEKTAAGDFAGAFAVFARHIPFPAIVAHVCDHPCEPACRRGERGGAVAIGRIERAIVEEAYVGSRRAVQKNRRAKRVAVVGAGLAGLSAAHDLAVRGHAVTVYEADARPLERLHRDYPPEVLPPSAIEADLGGLARLGVEIRCRARVAAGDGPIDLSGLIETNDAVLVALGPGPAAAFAALLPLDGDGRIAADPDTCATALAKVFSTGRLTEAEGGYSPIGAIHDGRRAGGSIERFLQGASLTAARSDEGAAASRLHVNVEAHPPVAPVVPADPAHGFRRDEAIAEAARCFPCHCLECVKVCEWLAFWGSNPKRYVREIYNNDSIVMGNRKSNRMIDGCTLCGLCGEVCPTGLDMSEVVLAARRSMVGRGKMPPSHHEFALLDMAAARAPTATLARHRPGRTRSATVFFPGCQLSASAPGAVEKAWDHLDGRISGGVGLWLDCCGAPAHWAGREALVEETITGLRTTWEGLGRPKLITACSSCRVMIEGFLPEIEIASLWECLAGVGLPAGANAAGLGQLAIHDPCTTRGRPEVQRAVRDLAGRLGLELRELGGADLTTCCGFGGLSRFADREVAERIVTRRTGEDAADYLAYCATCRDAFQRAGKRTAHLAELIFPDPERPDPAGRPDPGLSARRRDRAELVRRLKRERWGETMAEAKPAIDLDISEAVRLDMERRLILIDDIVAVIAEAEASGRRLIDPATGRRIASRRVGEVTFWADYQARGSGFVLARAWSHRMNVEVAP